MESEGPSFAAVMRPLMALLTNPFLMFWINRNHGKSWVLTMVSKISASEKAILSQP